MDTDDPDLDRFDSRRPTVYASEGVVATSQPLAAEAGRELLRDGGNAFDAAVATAAALNVVEPTSTGLGGDVFAMFRTADGEVGAMRASGGAPEGATRDRVREAVADDADPAGAEMPVHGPHAVTVPGTARGWEATVQAYGRRTLADALAPAIRYATDGYPVTEVVAAQWAHGEDLFTDDHAREAYLFGGESPGVVYEGDVAEAIADEVQSQGGFMTVDDLAAFGVEWPDPLSTTYNGVEVFELGPHNQGQVALEALNIAAETGAGEHPYDSAERVHAFAEALKLAFVDGHHYVTDPEYEDVMALHERSYARERAQLVGEDTDTVLLTVAAAEGNVVSYINSRYMGFGSGLVAGDTGIALQNRGASFSLSREDPNRLEPGKRPFHTLVPGLAHFGAEADRADWAAFGVMGGYMQPQGHLQTLANVVDYGMPVQAALDAPRWRYREDGALAIEDRFPRGVAPKLARKGHEVRVEPPGQFGGAQLARYDEGTLSGATEPRKDGQVAPY